VDMYTSPLSLCKLSIFLSAELSTIAWNNLNLSKVCDLACKKNNQLFRMKSSTKVSMYLLWVLDVTGMDP
jgi:hypothetical protein